MKKKVFNVVTCLAMMLSVFVFPLLVRAEEDLSINTSEIEPIFKYALSYDNVNYEEDVVSTTENFFNKKDISIDFTKEYVYFKVIEAVGKEYSGTIVNVDPSAVVATLCNSKGIFNIANNQGVFKIPTSILNQPYGPEDKLSLELPGVSNLNFSRSNFAITSPITNAVFNEVDFKEKEYEDINGNIISIDENGKVKFTNENTSDNICQSIYNVSSTGVISLKEVMLCTFSANMYFTYDEVTDSLIYSYTSSASKPNYISEGTTFTRYKVAASIQGKTYKTINEAYTDAKDGDVITLESGPFPENLNINKNVTFTGKGNTNTTIKGKITISDCDVIFNDLSIENNIETAYGSALITYPSAKPKASAVFNNCVIYDNDTAFRIESANSKLTLNNTDVTGKKHYGIGVRNINQKIDINGGTIFGWAGIMTSGGSAPTKNSGTIISVKDATIIGDLGTNKGSYGAIVLQENYHGVTLKIDNSSIIAKGNLISALDIRAYGSKVDVSNSKLIADDLVYGAIDEETKLPNYAGAVTISENKNYENLYKDVVEKPGSTISFTNTQIACKQIEKNENIYKGTYPITNSRTGDSVYINGIDFDDYKKLSLLVSEIAIQVNETKLLNVIYDSAYYYDKVTYKSSNTNVATVDANGKITAKAVGTTTITATAGDKNATCAVKVYKVEAPVIPTLPTKPVDKPTVGVTDSKAVEVISETASNLIDSIVNGGTVDTSIISTAVQEKIIEAMAAGKEITTKVESTPIDAAKVEKAVVTKVENAIKKLEIANKSEIVVAQYLDLGIALEAEGTKLGNINKLEEPIKFTVALPSELKVEGRKYYVVRIHGEETTLLEATLNEDGTLTFETDEFSMYALVYEDVKLETPTPTPDPVPDPTPDPIPDSTPDSKPGVDTGDTSNATMLLIMLVAAGSLGVYATKRRMRKN